jgi:hypothetical protein
VKEKLGGLGRVQKGMELKLGMGYKSDAVTVLGKELTRTESLFSGGISIHTEKTVY